MAWSFKSNPTTFCFFWLRFSAIGRPIFPRPKNPVVVEGDEKLR
jgi:hypothetical protein